MIKFFRYFRQKLLSENQAAEASSPSKFRRYLLYAIGEIILVVIGILIALQINNWNERRKDRIIEEQILEEMIISLKSDSSTFEMLENRLIEKDSAIQKILNLREQNALPFGRSFGELVGVARQTIRFTYDKSPYENLVALGINKMSDKELLKAINKYYTQQLPRSAEFIDRIQEQYLPKMQRSEEEAIERGILKKEFVKRDGDDKWSILYQSNPNELLKDKKFYQSMVDDFQYMTSALIRLRNLINHNVFLIEQLER